MRYLSAVSCLLAIPLGALAQPPAPQLGQNIDVVIEKRDTILTPGRFLLGPARPGINLARQPHSGAIGGMGPRDSSCRIERESMRQRMARRGSASASAIADNSRSTWESTYCPQDSTSLSPAAVHSALRSTARCRGRGHRCRNPEHTDLAWERPGDQPLRCGEQDRPIEAESG